jgi:hypothetical protein
MLDVLCAFRAKADLGAPGPVSLGPGASSYAPPPRVSEPQGHLMVWPDGRGGVWATVKRLLAARLAPTLSESPQSHNLGEYRQRHAHAEGRAHIAAGPGSYIPSTILNYPHGVPRRRIGAQRLLGDLADLAH